jgi:alkaline phosphatase D
MQEVLKAEDARFLLLVGDQIYSDGIPNLNVKRLTDSGSLDPAHLTEYYRQLYRGYFNEAGFRSILELVPSYMIWDDHDILDNWGSFPQPNDFERSAFAAATQAYLEYQHPHNPGATLRAQPPFCYSFWYADVGFLVLDLRSQRDFDAGRVIGQEQWDNLESFLAEATEGETRTTFVVVTIPVVHFPPAVVRLLDGLPGNKGENIRDRWDAENFRLQRDRLLHRLCDWQAR